jgi:HD superfamily phosphohydrolase
MAKNIHEIRDPIHVFVRLDSPERDVLNSRPFQRLRHIHQLALTYLVYPGATHKRFEHSLGVMELASRVFDVVTNPDNVSDESKQLLPQIGQQDEIRYWRRVVRMAALCHDIGHLPFSHAAEKELLPDGWDHERLTREIILSEEMKSIWNSITPPLRPEDVVKLSIGPKKSKDLEFSDWESILSEIIVGDAFGVDRMDYLLRDSHHLGVAYGRFDHYRLIDTLRILSSSPTNEIEGSREPALGVEEGGIHSAEALMLARYFMYSQVYLHSIRRIYDIHLMDFLKEWLPNGSFSTDIQQLIKMTDNEITAALLDAAFDKSRSGHQHAFRIIKRKHFKVIYQRNPNDIKINPEAGQAVYDALKGNFEDANLRYDRYVQKSGTPDFPVRLRDGQMVSSLAISETLKNVPVVSIDYVFSDRDILEKASHWLSKNSREIIQPQKEEKNDG